MMMRFSFRLNLLNTVFLLRGPVNAGIANPVLWLQQNEPHYPPLLHGQQIKIKPVK